MRYESLNPEEHIVYGDNADLELFTGYINLVKGGNDVRIYRQPDQPSSGDQVLHVIVKQPVAPVEEVMTLID